MPFGYFGAKHGLARFYPPPKYSTVIEPFAGSAAYSCYWTRQGLVKHVILIDKNPRVVALWHRLQKMTVNELYAIPSPIKGDRTLEPLIAAASGQQGMAVMSGKSRQITDRMVASWPNLRHRIEAMLPFIKDWEVCVGDYSSVESGVFTWFVDPPYKPRLGNDQTSMSAGGAWYAGGAWHPGASFNFGSQFEGSYDELGDWCKSLSGQVVVCEQEPADWLPFVPFRRQRNGVGAGTGSTRTEVVYTQGCE